MSIAFDGISGDLVEGGIYTEIKSSGANVSSTRPKVSLLVVPLAETAKVAPLTLARIFTEADAERLLGAATIGTAMARAFLAAAPGQELWIVGVEKGDSNATGSIAVTVTGGATSAGTIALYIGGIRVAVSIVKGATSAQITDAIADAINDTADVPVTAVVADGAVSLTSRDQSILANQIAVAQDFFNDDQRAEPTGVALSIAQPSGGVGTAVAADIIDAMAGRQFDTIVWPYQASADVAAMAEELSRRWGPLVQQEGQLFCAVAGDVSDATTFASTFNSPFVSVMSAGDSISPAYLWATLMAAVDTAEPDPARPRVTLPMTGLRAPKTRWDNLERRSASLGGASTHTVDASGVVLADRFLTTYRLNANGLKDTSYRELTTPRTLAQLRYEWRARVQATYPRHKLARDGQTFDPGQPVVQPVSIRALSYVLYQEWVGRGLTQCFDDFKDRLIVEINADDPNRLDCQMQVFLLGKFLTLATSMLFEIG